MADIELCQGDVSPVLLISPPNDGVTLTLAPEWACKLGVYGPQGIEEISRDVTDKVVSTIGTPEREYFTTFLTELETANLGVGEYTIAITMYETTSTTPPKYRKEIHRTLKIGAGFVNIV
jgi:hypothetical protein